MRICSHLSKFSVLFKFFFFHSFVIIFLPYTWNDLSHWGPALMALTFPAAYYNRNVIFISLVYIALLWLINFLLLLLPLPSVCPSRLRGGYNNYSFSVRLPFDGATTTRRSTSRLGCCTAA